MIVRLEVVLVKHRVVWHESIGVRVGRSWRWVDRSSRRLVNEAGCLVRNVGRRLEMVVNEPGRLVNEDVGAQNFRVEVFIFEV